MPFLIKKKRRNQTRECNLKDTAIKRRVFLLSAIMPKPRKPIWTIRTREKPIRTQIQNNPTA